MTDQQALYQAICASPDEDAPRLAYADLLEEGGAPAGKVHARLIRAQIEMTRLEEQSPAWRKLFAEERRLITRITREKIIPLDHLDKRRAGSIGYERGFLAEIMVHGKRFLEEAERFFADDPIQTLRFAKLTARQGSVAPATLFGSSHLQQIRKLDLADSDFNNEMIGLIATSKHLTGLRSLSLKNNGLVSKDLVRLIDSPGLPALKSLDLSNNPGIGDDAAIAFAKRPGLRRLRRLDLNHTGLTFGAVRAIAGSPYSAGLESLRMAIGYNVAESVAEHEGAARAIAGSPQMANLKELDLTCWVTGVQGLRALGCSPHLKNLRQFRLFSRTPPSAIRELIQGPNFHQLYQLVAALEGKASEADETLLRESLPEAAIRFE